MHRLTLTLNYTVHFIETELSGNESTSVYCVLSNLVHGDSNSSVALIRREHEFAGIDRTPLNNRDLIMETVLQQVIAHVGSELNCDRVRYGPLFELVGLKLVCLVEVKRAA
jgi:hypothetical protein